LGEYFILVSGGLVVAELPIFSWSTYVPSAGRIAFQHEPWNLCVIDIERMSGVVWHGVAWCGVTAVMVVWRGVTAVIAV
jgi:hypothetical protein